MRKGQAKIREVYEDPIYRHKLVTKLINRSMHDGKRTVAQKHVYRAFELIKTETNDEPVKVFLSALESIKPQMEVRPRRIGGASYQVPIQVRGARREALAIRWLVQNANLRPNSQYKTFANKLASEIMDAARGEGGAVAKKKDMERVAEANRAFSHFRW